MFAYNVYQTINTRIRVFAESFKLCFRLNLTVHAGTLGLKLERLKQNVILFTNSRNSLLTISKNLTERL